MKINLYIYDHKIANLHILSIDNLHSPSGPEDV
jgi:hypothetical protein